MNINNHMEGVTIMSIMSEKKPIKEPYSKEVLEELEVEWKAEKERLIEADVTIPKNVEPLARRVFFNGFIAAANTPPF